MKNENVAKRLSESYLAYTEACKEVRQECGIGVMLGIGAIQVDNISDIFSTDEITVVKRSCDKYPVEKQATYNGALFISIH